LTSRFEPPEEDATTCAARRPSSRRRDRPGDLSHELDYVPGHTSFAMTLATATEPFRGPLLLA
jgi:hypothetical protein